MSLDKNGIETHTHTSLTSVTESAEIQCTRAIINLFTEMVKVDPTLATKLRPFLKELN